MLGNLIEAVSGAVSIVHKYQEIHILILWMKIAAMRYTNEPAPSTAPRPRQIDHKGGDSTSQVGVEASDMNSSSVGLPRRSHKHETVRDHKKTQRNSSELAGPQAASESVLAEFQNALTEREKELEEKRIQNKELSRDYSKAFEKIQEQAQTIKAQSETIAQREDDAKSMIELLDTIVVNRFSPFAYGKAIHPKKWTRAAVLHVAKALSDDADDANMNAAKVVSHAADNASLQEQVRTLQKELLAKVEKVHVASDEHFAKEFRAIVSLVKTLSRTTQIKETVDVAKILGPGQLLKDVLSHHWSSRAKKKALAEAWIWSVLLEKVFRSPFVIFGTQCNILIANWTSIYRTSHFNGWPEPTELCEAWRCTTVESMLERVSRDVIARGEEKENLNQLEVGVRELRKETLNFIGSRLSNISSTPAEASQVQDIVDKAFQFALQMSLQRVRLQITYPKVGEKFNEDTMSCVSDPDDKDAGNEAVAFIVNPGLTKWGDTHGKNFDQRYDIVPSLVHVAEPPKPEPVQAKPGQEMWANVAKRGLKGASTSDRKDEGGSQR